MRGKERVVYGDKGHLDGRAITVCSHTREMKLTSRVGEDDRGRHLLALSTVEPGSMPVLTMVPLGTTRSDP